MVEGLRMRENMERGGRTDKYQRTVDTTCRIEDLGRVYRSLSAGL